MVRPSPVPPYLRVVVLSACSKARKIRSRPSGGMPMPVSVTMKRRTVFPSGAVPSATSTRTDTSSLPGELDRVADQVEQHLPQPARVADQGVGHVRLHVADQFQPLVPGPHAQGPHGVAQRRPEREVGRDQLQLAGLDLLEVEQVVDEAEEVVGGRLGRLQALPLVVGQRRVEHELGHAEDGAEGGADLVADVGQELVLGPVRRLGRLLGLPQRLLGLRPLDPVRGLAGQQVEDVQVPVRGSSRGAVVRGEHADELTGAGGEGRGLDGPDAGGEQHVQCRCARKHGLAATSPMTTRSPPLHGGAAGGLSVVDGVEELEERRVEAAAGLDLERPGTPVEELDVAHVGGGDGDGGVHDLEQERRRVPVMDQPVAHLLKPPHAGQVGGQPLLGFACVR